MCYTICIAIILSRFKSCCPVLNCMEWTVAQRFWNRVVYGLSTAWLVCLATFVSRFRVSVVWGELVYCTYMSLNTIILTSCPICPISTKQSTMPRDVRTIEQTKLLTVGWVSCDTPNHFWLLSTNGFCWSGTSPLQQRTNVAVWTDHRFWSNHTLQ